MVQLFIAEWQKQENLVGLVFLRLSLYNFKCLKGKGGRAMATGQQAIVQAAQIKLEHCLT
jgi:hypothetical protein